MTDSCEIPYTCSFESSRPPTRFMLLKHGLPTGVCGECQRSVFQMGFRKVCPATEEVVQDVCALGV